MDKLALKVIWDLVEKLSELDKKNIFLLNTFTINILEFANMMQKGLIL